MKKSIAAFLLGIALATVTAASAAPSVPGDRDQYKKTRPLNDVLAERQRTINMLIELHKQDPAWVAKIGHEANIRTQYPEYDDTLMMDCDKDVLCSTLQDDVLGTL